MAKKISAETLKTLIGEENTVVVTGEVLLPTTTLTSSKENILSSVKLNLVGNVEAVDVSYVFTGINENGLAIIKGSVTITKEAIEEIAILEEKEKTFTDGYTILETPLALEELQETLNEEGSAKFIVSIPLSEVNRISKEKVVGAISKEVNISNVNFSVEKVNPTNSQQYWIKATVTVTEKELELANEARVAHIKIYETLETDTLKLIKEKLDPSNYDGVEVEALVEVSYEDIRNSDDYDFEELIAELIFSDEPLEVVDFKSELVGFNPKTKLAIIKVSIEIEA